MKYDKTVKKQIDLELRVSKLKAENNQLKKENFQLMRELNKQKLVNAKTSLENINLKRGYYEQI